MVLDGSSQGVRADSPGEGMLLAGSVVNLRKQYLRPRRPCRLRWSVPCVIRVSRLRPERGSCMQ